MTMQSPDQKDHRLNSTGQGVGEHPIKKELWDGNCFAELSWFGILSLSGHYQLFAHSVTQ